MNSNTNAISFIHMRADFVNLTYVVFFFIPEIHKINAISNFDHNLLLFNLQIFFKVNNNNNSLPTYLRRRMECD